MPKIVEPFIVLICGDRVRRHEYEQRVYNDVSNLQEKMRDRLMILHGDCTGVDTIAGESARYLGIPEIKVPAQWKFYHKPAGIIRNEWMLRLQPKLVLGYHCNWPQSRGTADMMKRAEAAKIMVCRNTIRVREV